MASIAASSMVLSELLITPPLWREKLTSLSKAVEWFYADRTQRGRGLPSGAGRSVSRSRPFDQSRSTASPPPGPMDRPPLGPMDWPPSGPMESPPPGPIESPPPGPIDLPPPGPIESQPPGPMELGTQFFQAWACADDTLATAQLKKPKQCSKLKIIFIYFRPADRS